MEHSDEFKWAVKVVIKRQMRDLINQLQEDGEEVAIMSVNVGDESCSLFGSPTGEWFLSEQKNLLHTFMNFCKKKGKRNDGLSDTSQAAPSVPYMTLGSMQKADGTSRVKQNTPGRKPKHLAIEPDPALIQVTIPTDMAPNATEEELASLASRVFAAKVVAGKMYDHATKFDDLVDTIAMRDLKGEGKRAGSSLKTPSSKKQKISKGNTTRSGRKVSSKFLEGINSLKKSRPAAAVDETQDNEEEEDTVEDKGEEYFNLLEEICDLDPVALRRFHVSTSEGNKVNVANQVFVNTADLEAVAAPLIQAIARSIQSAIILDSRNIQLIVGKEEMTPCKIKVEIGDIEDTETNIKLEKAVESEDENEVDSTLDDAEEEDSDIDYGDCEGARVIETSSTPKEAKSVTIGKRGIPVGKLIRRPKKRSATELMLMKCEQCGISVTGKSNLKSHIRRIHLNVRNFTCTICGKGFWSNNARESHMLAVHTRKCESCQEYVVESVPWGVGVDMKTKRDVICTCGSIVSIYSTFGRRRMYLRDDEPDEEGNVRTSRSKSNTGTKYACGTCGKLFMKKSNCERHSRAHTDMKMCVCDICGSSYAYESSLKKHMHTEHGVAKHVCELCGGNYSNLTALKVHMVKAHHNVAIGDNVAIVVQTKGEEIDEDLEEIEESLQAKEMENNAQREAMGMKDENVVVSREESGQKNQQLFIQTSSGQQLLVSTSDSGILHSHTGDSLVRTAEVQVQEEELQLDEGDAQQVVISTEGGDVSQARTTEIVEEVLRSGQIVAQEGGMSIIIKQVPMDSAEMQ